ncbi:acyl-CoA thioesterase-2 [Mumia flava]|uniref:Acyl-CoA thioesterase-2 n=1 Tax=Mumia flava TaxID=1348852 RepID=A0A0B2BJW9_9ACTN|nr:acyl-CoA thioesterase domain-containing protein [Mumia flava]PJJ57339.1 acyl-CoA thioesterase-2 [Mumia flava]
MAGTLTGPLLTEGPLNRLFTLEQTGTRRWVGASDVVPLPQLFGGQLVGQSIVAAGHCAGPETVVHSTHTSFLRPGTTGSPVHLDVEVLREGGRSCVHEVRAHQDGRLVCRTAVASSAPADGIDHARTTPAVAPPEDSVDLRVLAQPDGGLGEFWEGFTAIEVRVAPVEEDVVPPHSATAARNIWMRAPHAIGDDPVRQRAALAYASDLMLMATAVAPHGAVTGHERTMAEQWWAVSLDHALWFQGDVRADEWMLFEHTTPMADAGRALVNAAVFGATGAPICQVSQAALVRRRPPAA